MRALTASWWHAGGTPCASPNSSGPAARDSQRRLFSPVSSSRAGHASGPPMVEAQCLAATVLGQVLDGRSLDAELAAAWRRHGALDAHNRAVAQDLAYGTLRFLPRFEALLEALLDKPLKDAQLRALLLVVLYQLERTRAAPHAVVDHAVRTCGVLGLASAKGLVNAVLRNFLRRRTELDAHVQRSEAARYCHPQW